MKEDWYIIAFGIVIIVLILILHNYKKSECEKSGGMLYSEMYGKTVILKCYKDT